jgi:FkbM family methyltransferase
MKITKHGIAILENDHCICKWVEESGRLDHDQNMLPLVLKHINAGDVVIDAGGFVGDHTIAYAQKVGTSGHVHAFEPSADSFECLVYNLYNYLSVNTSVYNKGLGSEPKKVDMIMVEGNEGMNYMASGDSVEIVTLDGMSLDRVNFIKIDVEGYELEILKGAIETIKKHKPKMLIEINQMALERMNLKREDIFQFLDEHGYTYANIYPNQSLTEYQLDILCLPK